MLKVIPALFLCLKELASVPKGLFPEICDIRGRVCLGVRAKESETDRVVNVLFGGLVKTKKLEDSGQDRFCGMDTAVCMAVRG